jgi:hypothetical protein
LAPFNHIHNLKYMYFKVLTVLPFPSIDSSTREATDRFISRYDTLASRDRALATLPAAAPPSLPIWCTPGADIIHTVLPMDQLTAAQETEAGTRQYVNVGMEPHDSVVTIHRLGFT